MSDDRKFLSDVRERAQGLLDSPMIHVREKELAEKNIQLAAMVEERDTEISDFQIKYGSAMIECTRSVKEIEAFRCENIRLSKQVELARELVNIAKELRIYCLGNDCSTRNMMEAFDKEVKALAELYRLEKE